LIVFRNCDPRYPFLWEDRAQPAARWHAAGDGPAQYFIRHEEITDLADLAMIRRAIWAADIDIADCQPPALLASQLIGDETTYPACQREAANMRRAGVRGVIAPSAALKPGEAAGYVVDGGQRGGAARDGRVFVLFGSRPDVTGWLVAADARPPARLLDQTRPL